MLLSCLCRNLQSIRRTLCTLFLQQNVIFSVGGTKTKVQPMHRLFLYWESLRALGGKFTLIYSGSQKPHIKWKRQKYFPT